MDELFHVFITLFIVVDPIGIAPMFVSLVRGGNVSFVRRMAIRSTSVAAGILFVFFFIGDKFLEILGIGMLAFRIAGGVLLFLLAIDMVFARQSGLRSTTVREQEEAEHKQDISVFPLAFPLISGPGALTTVLLMATTKADSLLYIGMIVILAVVLILTLVSLLYAGKLTQLLGETGTNVISRLFGLILAALAVQFILDGITASVLK